MKARKPTAPDRKQLLAAIRTAEKRTGQGKLLTFTKFLTISKYRPQYIFRHFSKWNDALRAAGFAFERFNAPVTNARLLEDWGRCARKHRRIPTHLEYNLGASHSTTTFIKRFGKWSKVPAAFRAFATKSANGTRKWRDVLALIPFASAGSPEPAERAKPDHRKQRKPRQLATCAPCPPNSTHGEVEGRGRQPLRRRTCPPKPRGRRIPGRPICGAPLDFACLRHAPANEAGVLVLFGAMARDLGFLIDSLQAEFPDCEAKRLIAPDTWQSVRIEFEYQSKNFLTHGHDPKGCDLIMCWEHNWLECPEALDVLALKGELKSLGRHI